jgi:hypothetical protein
MTRAILTVAAASVAALLATALACSRSGPGSPTPVPTLATSERAQRDWQDLRHRWLLLEGRERLALEPRMRQFRSRFSADPTSRLADVHLGWLAVERGDYAAARAAGLAARGGPAGTTQDLGRLVEGAVLCKTGRPEAALDLLTPLVGKLIDPWAQDLLSEQLVDATVQARRWFEAVAYMDAWLAPSEQDRDAARAKVASQLARFPADTLVVALRAMRAASGHGGYGDEIRAAISAQLLARSDPGLARSVIETSGSIEALGDAGVGLAQLASSGGGAPRVAGSTVGFVLLSGEAQARERSAEALEGLLDVLGPSQAGPEPGAHAREGARLVTREHAGAVTTLGGTLAQLAHDGAAVVVAGVDAGSAEAASAFAESTSWPLIVLSAPPALSEAARLTFVLGEDDAGLARRTRAAAASAGHALVGEVATVASGGSGPFAPCASAPAKAGEARFAFARWRAAGVSAVAVEGPAWCAADVLDEIGRERPRPAVVLGIETFGVEIPAGLGAPVLVARAGLLGPDAFGPRCPPPLAAWRAAHGRLPGWFAALARDAALLARRAVEGLPADTSAEPREVAARRARALRALESAQADLLTTTARGFGGARAMPRAVTYEK